MRIRSPSFLFGTRVLQVAGIQIQRRGTLALLVLLVTLALTAACSGATSTPGDEPGPAPRSEVQGAFASKYAELRQQGKSHKAATELAAIHTGGRVDAGTVEDTREPYALDSAIVLARFSTEDRGEGIQREQATEELKIRFQSGNLDDDRAMSLLDTIAPEASISDRRHAARELVRLSQDDAWDDRNTMKAADELKRLITGDAVNAGERIKAANELARRSKAGDLDTDGALHLLDDIAPEMSISERREAASNLASLSQTERWDAETLKQAAEESYQLVTGSELNYEKRRDAAVDLTGEAIKRYGGDSYDDEDVDVATELIQQSFSGDLDTDSVSDLLNLND